MSWGRGVVLGVRPSIHLRLATADRLRDRTRPNYIQLKRSLSLSKGRFPCTKGHCLHVKVYLQTDK